MATGSVIVTGGSAGVGRAVVARLIAEGFRVGVIARGEERLKTLEEEYGEDRLRTRACDVADAAGLLKAGQELSEALGAPRAWINCAMLTSFSPFNKMAPEEFDRIVEGTFLGQVNGTRAALEVLDPDAEPVVVNVGSGLAYRAVPFQSAYCAAKHAINGFSASLQSELIRAESPVRLSLVQLPAINTPQFDWARHRFFKQPQPAPPIYQPEVAAEAVLRAVKERPRELFVGQSVLKLTFGNMVLPDWLDRKMADSGAEMQKSDRDATPQREGNLRAPDPEIGAEARGSYGGEAKEKGLIVDADRARLIFFGGSVLGAFLIGLVLG
jgi:NAD(P)-dependent dehydrogenase (short-subunit alcohol dehydrogenase family)